MHDAADVKVVQERFGANLQRLDSAYFVLRTVCEPDWLDLSVDKTALRIHGHLNELFTDLDFGQLPPLIRAVIDDDQDESSQATRIRELYASIRGEDFEGREIDFLGLEWEKIRCAFAGPRVKSLPRPFRERMADGEDVIRKVWLLWFQPRSERALMQLSDWIRDEICEGFGYPVRTWKDVAYLLRDPLLKPCWPNMAQVREKMAAVCSAFLKEGRTSLKPTDAEIQDAAFQIVAQHEPSRATSSDKLFAARIASGDLKLSGVLWSEPLQAEVGRVLEPVPPSMESIRQNLQQLVDAGRLDRRDINGEILYLTSDPRETETPCSVAETPHWNVDRRILSFRGKQVKAYKSQPADNQTKILTAFQIAGWPRVIDDPFPKSGPIQRLAMTAKDLNKALRDSGFRFGTDGTGEHIFWEITAS